MAGTVEKGITIEFRGNSVSFDNTVDNVNKAIKLLQSEAGRLNRELKLDPTNVDLLTKRFQALVKAQELTTQQLSTYRKALFDSVDSDVMRKNVAEWSKLEKEIAKNEQRAGELNNEMKALVDSNGVITDTQRWQELRDEQVKVNSQLAYLTDQLVLAGQTAENGITNPKQWLDAVKHVSSLNLQMYRLQTEVGKTTPKIVELHTTIQGLTKLETGLQNISNTFGTIAKNTQKFSIASGNALKESARAAIDFEEAFAGVKKTVNETTTTSYEDLALAMRQMSKEIPVTTRELAQIGEISGQLGVGADDLMEFTRVIADLGATTNVSGNEAATAIARIFNITSRGDFSNVDRFAATLVELGNNAATDERTILELTQRLSSSARMAGMTQPEMLALATAMSSVGLNAEAGGSAISRIMQDITKVVAENGASLKTWAKVANMSASEFAKSWRSNAAGTLNEVIKGLASARGEGEDVILLLDELDVSNIRTIDTMQRLVSAGDLLEGFMTMSNNAWEENSALVNEASKKYETTQSKITILKNTLENLAYSLGETLLPMIQQTVDKLQVWVNKFTELPEGTKKFILALAGIGASISPVAKMISNLTGEKGLAGLIGKLKELTGTAGAGGTLAKIFGGLGNASGGITGFISGLGTALKGLLSALGPVGIAIAVIVSALIAAYTHSEEVRKKVGEMIQTVKDNLLPIIQGLWNWLKELWELIKVSLAPVFDLLVVIGEALWLTISSLIEIIAKLIGWLFGESGLGPVLEGLWQLIKWIVETIMVDVIGKAIYGLIQGIRNVIDWVKNAYNWFMKLIGAEKQFDGNTAASRLGNTVRSGGKLVGGPQSVLDSDSLGIQPSMLGRLAFASGGGNTLSLTTNINVTNNGDPIDEAEIRRWGNVITDVVSNNLGKRW